MVRVNEIAFVAHAVTDKQRARDFYEGVLGLTQESGHDFPEGFWIEYAIGTGTLALSNYWKPSGTEGHADPSIALEVEDFDATIAALRAHGSPFVTEPMETPVCHLAVVKDPDGNAFFIHKRKPGHG